jgi:hypothetical protein
LASSLRFLGESTPPAPSEPAPPRPGKPPSTATRFGSRSLRARYPSQGWRSRSSVTALRAAPPRRRGPELDNGRRGKTVVERWPTCQVNVVLGGEVTVRADACPARPSKAEPGSASRRS